MFEKARVKEQFPSTSRSSPPEVLCNFIEITLLQECSPVNLLHIFRTRFPKNTSELN